jgi:hypothetical protein
MSDGIATFLQIMAIGPLISEEIQIYKSMKSTDSRDGIIPHHCKDHRSPQTALEQQSKPASLQVFHQSNTATEPLNYTPSATVFAAHLQPPPTHLYL